MNRNIPSFFDIPNDNLPPEALEILYQIENLSFSVNGFNLYWVFKEMNGTVQISDVWIKNLIKEKPTNFMELLSLML